MASISHSIPTVAMTAYLADQRLEVGLWTGAVVQQRGSDVHQVERPLGREVPGTASGDVPGPLAALAVASMVLLLADEVSALQCHRSGQQRQQAMRLLGVLGGSSLTGGHPKLSMAELGVARRKPGLRLNRDLACIICLEAMEAQQQVAWPSCGHCFHAACIHRWFEHRALCPFRCCG